MAIQGLHGFQLGDRTLVVQRAEVGRNTGIPGAYTGGLVAQAILQSANATDAPSSRVMLLLNMVTPEELYDDAEYEDILADINDECGKYGEIEGVRVPRPVPKSKKWESTEGTALTAEKNRKIDAENGVGRVYVMYKDIDSATKAMKALGGRQFAGRTILVANVPEVSGLGRLSCRVIDSIRNANVQRRRSSSVRPRHHRHQRISRPPPKTRSRISWRVLRRRLVQRRGPWRKSLVHASHSQSNGVE
jgi:hypothetical protein